VKLCPCRSGGSGRCHNLRHWLHVNWYARRLNTVYTAGRHITSYVETAVPSRWLARYAAHPETRHVARVERAGRLRRRWTLTR
jgi:hypothetical protein